MKSRIMLLLLAFASTVACAKPAYRPRIEQYGDATDSAQLNERARRLPSAEVNDVRVVVGVLPDGVTLQDGVMRVSTESEYAAVLGEVDMVRERHGTSFSRYAEEESWKDVYCNAQVPIFALTLQLWAYVPLGYPCLDPGAVFGGVQRDSYRQAQILTAKKAATALGGDLVLVVGPGESETFYILKKK